MPAETASLTAREATSLLRNVAEKTFVLHRPWADSAGLGGGDLDTAVDGLDLYWPLRLPTDWRFCLCLRYDITGTYWVLAGPGRSIAIDTLQDPDGIGAYAWPTTLPFQSGLSDVAIRAAYLTSKRIRKRITAAPAWSHIAKMAGKAPADYEQALEHSFGTSAAALAHQVLGGGIPSIGRYRRTQLLRRTRTLRRLFVVIYLTGLRIVNRMVHPTGFVVVVAGPDGAGKSTLARSLNEFGSTIFRRVQTVHWRPGVLPRPGALMRMDEGDHSTPQARPARSRPLSALLRGYYFFDFFLGAFKYAVARRRSTLVVIERGWWDMEVDPARYRLQARTRGFGVMHRLLPDADLTLVLAGTSAVIRRRKDELDSPEIDRQTKAWTELPIPNKVTLDASKTAAKISTSAREHLLSRMESRAVGDLGEGWVNLPNRKSERWTIPRGPRHVTARALALYHPVTAKGLVGLRVAQLVASLGGFRLLRRGRPPEESVRRAIAGFLPTGARIAVMAANHPERSISMIFDRSGEPFAVVKVANDPAGIRALKHELAALERWSVALPAPLSAPQVIAHGDGVILIEPTSWKTRRRPWLLPPDVAGALGEFYKSTRGRVHGDFAPWNLLQTDAAWALIDWEECRQGRPFEDVFHYVVQAAALLGRPGLEELIRGISGEGWIGDALRNWAEGAGRDLATASDEFVAYLDRSRDRFLPDRPDAAACIATRTKLLEMLGA